MGQRPSLWQKLNPVCILIQRNTQNTQSFKAVFSGFVKNLFFSFPSKKLLEVQQKLFLKGETQK